MLRMSPPPAPSSSESAHSIARAGPAAVCTMPGRPAIVSRSTKSNRLRPSNPSPPRRSRRAARLARVIRPSALATTTPSVSRSMMAASRSRSVLSSRVAPSRAARRHPPGVDLAADASSSSPVRTFRRCTGLTVAISSAPCRSSSMVRRSRGQRRGRPGSDTPPCPSPMSTAASSCRGPRGARADRGAAARDRHHGGGMKSPARQGQLPLEALRSPARSGSGPRDGAGPAMVLNASSGAAIGLPSVCGSMKLSAPHRHRGTRAGGGAAGAP